MCRSMVIELANPGVSVFRSFDDPLTEKDGPPNIRGLWRSKEWVVSDGFGNKCSTNRQTYERKLTLRIVPLQ